MYLFEERVSIPVLQQTPDVLAEGQSNVLMWIFDQINKSHEEGLGVRVTAAHIHVLTHVTDALCKRFKQGIMLE